MYVYIQSDKWSEHGITKYLWTVGFYDPDGKFQPESDHEIQEDAAKRVAWLNGSGNKAEDKP